jgi:hypothetical protein
MIIKDKIQIGGIWWTIKFVKELKDEDDNSLIYGECRYSEYTINICSDYPKEKQEVALLHEIRHAINDTLGYRHNQKIKLNEQLIIGSQHYDHQVMLQIIEWQKGE